MGDNSVSEEEEEKQILVRLGMFFSRRQRLVSCYNSIDKPSSVFFGTVNLFQVESTYATLKQETNRTRSLATSLPFDRVLIGLQRHHFSAARLPIGTQTTTETVTKHRFKTFQVRLIASQLKSHYHRKRTREKLPNTLTEEPIAF